MARTAVQRTHAAARHNHCIHITLTTTATYFKDNCKNAEKLARLDKWLLRPRSRTVGPLLITSLGFVVRISVFLFCFNFRPVCTLQSPLLQSGQKLWDRLDRLSELGKVYHSMRRPGNWPHVTCNHPI